MRYSFPTPDPTKPCPLGGDHDWRYHAQVRSIDSRYVDSLTKSTGRWKVSIGELYDERLDEEAGAYIECHNCKARIEGEDLEEV